MKKIVIIIPFILAILFMSIGYSLLETNLAIKGYATIYGDWNVSITNIKTAYESDGCYAGSPTFTNLSANFDAYLMKPGDYITYEITISNKGTIAAKLESIDFDFSGSDAIIITNTEPKDILYGGESTVFSVTITYDEDATEIPSVKTKNITGTIKYVQN